MAAAWGVYAQVPQGYTFDSAPGKPLPSASVAEKPAPPAELFSLLNEWENFRRQEEQTGWRKVSETVSLLSVLPQAFERIRPEYDHLKQTDLLAANDLRTYVINAADAYLVRMDVIANDGQDLPELMRAQETLGAFKQVFTVLNEPLYAEVAEKLREKCRRREAQFRYERKLRYIFEDGIY